MRLPLFKTTRDQLSNYHKNKARPPDTCETDGRGCTHSRAIRNMPAVRIYVTISTAQYIMKLPLFHCYLLQYTLH